MGAVAVVFHNKTRVFREAQQNKSMTAPSVSLFLFFFVVVVLFFLFCFGQNRAWLFKASIIQSIVSLMSLSRGQLVNCFTTL